MNGLLHRVIATIALLTEVITPIYTCYRGPPCTIISNRFLSPQANAFYLRPLKRGAPCRTPLRNDWREAQLVRIPSCEERTFSGRNWSLNFCVENNLGGFFATWGIYAS